MMALPRPWTSLALLLAVVVCSIAVDRTHAGQKSGNREARIASKYQHLKQQFALFKRELDTLLLESNDAPSERDGEEEAAVESQGNEAAQLEKRCNGCQDGDGDDDDDGRQKRCPSGCKKGGQTKTPKSVDCVKRCPGCRECVDDDGAKKWPAAPAAAAAAPAAAAAAAEAPQSEMMKRFLKAIPAEDRQLVESSHSKRQFIERLIRRTHHGPNANDVAAEKARAVERVNAIANIGVRSLPAEGSRVMSAFRRGLNPSERQLLQKYVSKTRFIEGALEKPGVHDKRDVEVPNERKRQLDDPVVADYLETLDDSQKALIKQHPSVAAHLKEAILKGSRADSADEQRKRELSPDQVQDVLGKLSSKEDAELFRKHMSKIEKLAEAEKRPVGNPDEEVDQVVSRLVTDIKAAKKRGYDLEKLLAAMKRRADESKASSGRN